jgi:transcriptional regulator with XRE-family HTH domain
MVNIDKIKGLAREQGKSIAYICSLLGKGRGFLNEVKYGKNSIEESELKIIADDLNTTPAYLKDETDEKNKPAEILDERTIRLNELMKKLTPSEIEQVLDYVRYVAERRKEKK